MLRFEVVPTRVAAKVYQWHRGFAASNNNVVPRAEPAFRKIVAGSHELTQPESLVELAAWCDGWNGKLRDGRAAKVLLSNGITLGMWAGAFRDMAK